jgi:hypothetical protein
MTFPIPYTTVNSITRVQFKPKLSMKIIAIEI